SYGPSLHLPPSPTRRSSDLARTSRALSAPAPRGARRRRTLLRTPRPQGRVPRPLPARPARVGVMAGRCHAHALALVPVLERGRWYLLGHGGGADRVLPRPICDQRAGNVRPLW